MATKKNAVGKIVSRKSLSPPSSSSGRSKPSNHSVSGSFPKEISLRTPSLDELNALQEIVRLMGEILGVVDGIQNVVKSRMNVYTIPGQQRPLGETIVWSWNSKP